MLNPFAFRPGPVVLWTSVVYLALLIPLVIINESVPPPPGEIPTAGLNLTEAWLDLSTLAHAYHPYNSKQNEVIRDWLLLRIQETLDQNGVSWTSELSGESLSSPQTSRLEDARSESNPNVVVFNDMSSNYSGAMPAGRLGTNAPGKSVAGQASYFEGTNILVYIRGTDDDQGKWWERGSGDEGSTPSKGGTLVNAHYDSVSTGYGATDDGMGVISVLQLIKYFTTPGHQPKRGIVALLNNGEEDFLYGARAFGQSPLLPFVHTFLNLEGAGGGGRALLFRTSDQEVTAAYSKTKNPFGTVIGSDSFSLGFIRSQTDFVVLDGVYGQRGLDLAFFKPRARYHTNEDSISQTSRASLWHMLSASVHTMINLSGDTGDTFVGPRGDGNRDKVQNGHPSDGVWFDLFGKGFVLFNLRGMFAWSLTILIVSPLALALVTYFLVRADKYYFFTSKVKTDDAPDTEPVSVGGLKGLFRFPFALVFAIALTLGTAFLLRKINPLIIYGGQYTVWATMISIFYFSFWLIMRGSSFVRPSALHKGYAHIWLFALGWAVLVAITVFEDRFKISSGYLFVFLQSALFLSTLITLAELFALPTRTSWAQQVRDDDEARDSLLAGRRPEDLIAPSPGEGSSSAAREAEDDEDPGVADETTPLVGTSKGKNLRTTFATTYRRSISAILDGTSRVKKSDHEPYEGEQPWSGRLPSWTWLLQFLLTGPFIIILAAQIGLALTDAVNQTGTDGSSFLLPYLLVAASSILVLLPITPFIHRVTHHVPLFLLVVFVGTLIYNLAAFPFSANNRFKLSFQQTIDLDTGATTNNFYGIEEYVRRVISELPSASGRKVECGSSGTPGIVACSYDGSAVAPNVGKRLPDGVPPQKGYGDLVSVNVTRGEGNEARFQIDAVDTKACFLHFKIPVNKFNVLGGSGWDDRFGRYPEQGVGLIKLWRRDRKKRWVVDVTWTDDESATTESTLYSEGDGQGVSALSDELRVRSAGLDGFVSCQWSDANVPGTIPALDEALQYSPTWAGVTKRAEGLVEGKKSFMV